MDEVALVKLRELIGADKLPDLPPAERNELLTRQLAENVKSHFILLGLALLENQEQAYWSVLKHESFRDYVESLGIGSYSWCCRLISTANIMLEQITISEPILTVEDVAEIGSSKMALLLPAIKKGKINAETIEIAKVASSRDLREHLGQPLIETDKEYSILCPRCNVKIIGAKWVVSTPHETRDDLQKSATNSD